MNKSFSPEEFLSHRILLAGPDGQPIDIPVGGSISLLALGDVGTIAWRRKIREVKSEFASRTRTHLAPNDKMNPPAKNQES